MALSDVDIKRLLKSGKMKIEPFSEEQIGPGSVDLTLSNEWYFFKNRYMGKEVDLGETPFRKVQKKMKADTVTLRPGEMCLGKTLEKISLPPDIMGRLEGRSRYARMGLSIHVTSALVQPGSRNHQILEMVNLSPFSIKIHAGMRVSQIVFDALRTATSRPYSKYGKIARRQ